MRVLFVIDPLPSLKLEKDTSVYLMEEGLLRGYDIYTTTVDQLFMQGGTACAIVEPLKDIKGQVAQELVVATQRCGLNDFDTIIMRKDPPFNLRYIYASYILEHASQAGVTVLNNPRSIRDCNEKFYITHFPQCITETIIAKSAELLFDFICQHDDIVLKALDSMGGDSVFRVKQAQFSRKADALIHFQQKIDQFGFLMAQRFLPEVFQGDKRIILIDGEPLPQVVVRLPQENEFRANLAQGGHYQLAPLTERDMWLCHQIAGDLKAKGLFFVGLDVIGDYISEINVTSPTCMRELASGGQMNPADDFWRATERKLAIK